MNIYSAFGLPSQSLDPISEPSATSLEMPSEQLEQLINSFGDLVQNLEAIVLYQQEESLDDHLQDLGDDDYIIQTYAVVDPALFSKESYTNILEMVKEAKLNFDTQVMNAEARAEQQTKIQDLIGKIEATKVSSQQILDSIQLQIQTTNAAHADVMAKEGGDIIDNHNDVMAASKDDSSESTTETHDFSSKNHEEAQSVQNPMGGPTNGFVPNNGMSMQNMINNYNANKDHFSSSSREMRGKDDNANHDFSSSSRMEHFQNAVKEFFSSLKSEAASLAPLGSDTFSSNTLMGDGTYFKGNDFGFGYKPIVLDTDPRYDTGIWNLL